MNPTAPRKVSAMEEDDQKDRPQTTAQLPRDRRDWGFHPQSGADLSVQPPANRGLTCVQLPQGRKPIPTGAGWFQWVTHSGAGGVLFVVYCWCLGLFFYMSSRIRMFILQLLPSTATSFVSQPNEGTKGLVITFCQEGRSYKLLIPKVRGGCVCPVSIVDETGADRYDEVLPYLGPNSQCYMTSVVSASYFGSEELTFKFAGGDTITFTETQPILFTPSETRVPSVTHRKLN
jgi:hypothetical protein